MLARAEEALKERMAAVSLPHVAMERGSTHSGVALRSAEGLWWFIEAGGFADAKKVQFIDGIDLRLSPTATFFPK